MKAIPHPPCDWAEKLAEVEAARLERISLMRVEEGDRCPDCGNGIMGFGRVWGCRCHISPPCSACVDNPLVCLECGWQYEKAVDSAYETPAAPVVVFSSYKSERTFRPGDRVYDCRYDGSSGSTMEWSGYFEGNVTKEDIIEFFGVGTFGKRGPFLNGNRFTYTLITD